MLILLFLLIVAVYLAVNWPFFGGTHNIAVTGIAISTTQVQLGGSVNITVTSKNEGSVTESFNVSLFLNSSLFDTKTVVDLSSNGQKDVIFVWDTSAAIPAVYLVKAEASAVSGETNVTDNVLTGNLVSIRSKPEGIAVVSVDPQNISVAVGESFSANIDILNVADLYGWEFKFGWNDTILNLQNVTEGSFLKDTGATFFTHSLNSTGPHIVVDCTRLTDMPEASGNGTLSTLTFQVQQSGSCDLNLYDPVLINSFEQSMNCTAEGGHFIEKPQ